MVGYLTFGPMRLGSGWVKKLTLTMFLCVNIPMGLLLAWWMIDREPPIHDIRATPVRYATQSGGWLETDLTITRTRSCPVTIEMTLEDANQNRFITKYERSGQTDLGVIHYIERQRLAFEMVPGPAHRVTKLYYHCNPLQWIWPVTVDGVEYHIEVTP